MAPGRKKKAKKHINLQDTEHRGTLQNIPAQWEAPNISHYSQVMRIISSLLQALGQFNVIGSCSNWFYGPKCGVHLQVSSHKFLVEIGPCEHIDRDTMQTHLLPIQSLSQQPCYGPI